MTVRAVPDVPAPADGDQTEIVSLAELTIPKITTFYDSAQWKKLPRGAAVCVYYDGDFAAPAAAQDEFFTTRWITVLGDWRNAGIADFEQGNEVYSKPGALLEWVRGRKSLGLRARVYCDRDNLPKVRALLKGETYLVWIGTLDGNKLGKDWTPGLWGVQYAGGPDADYDTSVLYGTW